MCRANPTGPGRRGLVCLTRLRLLGEVCSSLCCLTACQLQLPGLPSSWSTYLFAEKVPLPFAKGIVQQPDGKKFKSKFLSWGNCSSLPHVPTKAHWGACLFARRLTCRRAWRRPRARACSSQRQTPCAPRPRRPRTGRLQARRAWARSRYGVTLAPVRCRSSCRRCGAPVAWQPALVSLSSLNHC